jgi:hypothetical protein
MGPVEDSAPTLLDRRWTRIAAIAFAFLLVALVAGGVYWFERAGSRPSEDPVAIAQSLVLQQLPEGSTPHFNPPEWTQMRQLGRKYVISGWLQTVSREGEVVAMNYQVELMDGPQGWSADYVDLTVQ